MDINKKDVGIRIKNIRLNNGKNLREFGELISKNLNEKNIISDSIVSRWEKGVSIPNAKRLREIAILGNMTPNELLYGSKFSYKEIEENFHTLKIKKLFKEKIIDFLDNYMLFDNPNDILIQKTLDLLDILFEYEVTDMNMLVNKLYELVSDTINPFYNHSLYLLFNEDLQKLHVKLYLTEFIYYLFVQLSLNNPKAYLENLILQLNETKRNIRNISTEETKLLDDTTENKLANFINKDEYIDIFLCLQKLEEKIKSGKIINE